METTEYTSKYYPSSIAVLSSVSHLGNVGKTLACCLYYLNSCFSAESTVGRGKGDVCLFLDVEELLCSPLWTLHAIYFLVSVKKSSDFCMFVLFHFFLIHREAFFFPLKLKVLCFSTLGNLLCLYA